MKRIRRTHESIEYELSKGHTRDCPTSEELASWSDVCSPYHLYTKAVYVDNPYTLNFPERMSEISLTTLQDSQSLQRKTRL